jgi:hypothetical protein
MTMLETVVGSNPWCIADWNSHKAPLDAPLALFHKKFWGIEEEAGLSDNMEVDDSTDDEIHPRCYVLDINIRGVEEEKIWVRADYIECSNMPRNSTPNLHNCLHVLLSQVSQELVSFADVITLVLLRYRV